MGKNCFVAVLKSTESHSGFTDTFKSINKEMRLSSRTLRMKILTPQSFYVLQQLFRRTETQDGLQVYREDLNSSSPTGSTDGSSCRFMRKHKVTKI